MATTARTTGHSPPTSRELAELLARGVGAAGGGGRSLQPEADPLLFNGGSQQMTSPLSYASPDYDLDVDRLVQEQLVAHHTERCHGPDSIHHRAEYGPRACLKEAQGQARGTGWALLHLLGCGPGGTRERCMAQANDCSEDSFGCENPCHSRPASRLPSRAGHLLAGHHHSGSSQGLSPPPKPVSLATPAGGTRIGHAQQTCSLPGEPHHHHHGQQQQQQQHPLGDVHTGGLIMPAGDPMAAEYAFEKPGRRGRIPGPARQ